MEPHPDDGTTSEDPWRRANDEIDDLGRRLRNVYRSVADETGPSEGEIRDAFATLAGAWNQVAGTVGNALQDAEVRGHLKSAAGALAEALGATLSGLGDDLAGPDEEE